MRTINYDVWKVNPYLDGAVISAHYKRKPRKTCAHFAHNVFVGATKHCATQCTECKAFDTSVNYTLGYISKPNYPVPAIPIETHFTPDCVFQQWQWSTDRNSGLPLRMGYCLAGDYYIMRERMRP